MKELLFIFGVLILLLIVLFGGEMLSLSNKNTYEAIVTDLIVKPGHNSSKYLIFATISNQVKVFENTDSILAWKFNSSDVQASIIKGKKYKFKVYGWRIPFCSFYENILSANIINPEKKYK
jgi:hypothetical protein